MEHSTQDLQLADKMALALLESEIRKKFKNAETTQNAVIRIREAMRFAIPEAIKAYQENPSIDFATAMYMQLRAFLRLRSKVEGPLLFFVPENIAFKRKRSGPFRVLLIQPKPSPIDHFEEIRTSLGKLLVAKSKHLSDLKAKLRRCLGIIKKENADFACLPELSFVNDEQLRKEFIETASNNDLFIIAGSFHDTKEEANVSLIFCPNGQIIKQRKVYRSKEFGEGIKTREEELLHIFDFGQGKFSVLVCIDCEAEVIRNVLKERLLRCRCPELIFNPSLTKARKRAYSQLSSLMSLIFAAIAFCNAGNVGGSCVLYPAVDLKDTDFKSIQLPCCPTKDVHGKTTIDISKLQEYKQAKIKCLIAMKN